LIRFMKKKILDLLRKNRQGLTLQRIARELRILHKEQYLLKQTLQSLTEKGVILKERRKYFFQPNTHIIQGKLIKVNRGYGFVRPLKTGLKDIFIPARYAAGALLGDRVEVIYKEHSKPEGRILRIIKPARETMIGTVKIERGELCILPFDSPQAATIAVSPGSRIRAEPDDIVLVDRDSGTIKNVLGKPDDPGVDLQVITARFELGASFSEDALKEAAAVTSEIPELERQTRRDLRSWTTMTIDGENARDFDDAVSIKRIGSDRFLLGVHIADVSFYVQPDSALDRDAAHKATSVYFPETSFPMLPDRLSYDICSLSPGQDKLAFSVLLEIDKSGRVLERSFVLSQIRSDARLTYTEVYNILQGDPIVQKKYSALAPELKQMWELASLMKQNRVESGCLDFDFPEPDLIYEKNVIKGITASKINAAHSIIEEFMLAANVAAAELLQEKNISCLYRVHPPPLAGDQTKLRAILACYGYALPAPHKLGVKDVQAAQDWATDRPQQKFLSFQILRSLQLAAYSVENTGHFGLGKPAYTHFTSPIRRYPDLVIHRILKHLLAGRNPAGIASAVLAESCSERERNAEEAERELVNWRIYRWLKKKLGDETGGYMIEVTKAGILVELEEYFVSGMILYQDLGNDYFTPKDACTLSGRRSHQTYRLGDYLRVIIAAVDPELRRITLVPTVLSGRK